MSSRSRALAIRRGDAAKFFFLEKKRLPVDRQFGRCSTYRPRTEKTRVQIRRRLEVEMSIALAYEFLLLNIRNTPPRIANISNSTKEIVVKGGKT